uniref:Uncharacterized protein n=1 Tax=Rhizophora mucronata TaxID=61149 RepID=A0A2P2NSK4_RHIMU
MNGGLVFALGFKREDKSKILGRRNKQCQVQLFYSGE